MSTYSSWRNGLRRQLLHDAELTGLTPKKQLDRRIFLQDQKHGTPKLKTAQIKSEHTYLCKNCNNLNEQRIAHCLGLHTTWDEAFFCPSLSAAWYDHTASQSSELGMHRWRLSSPISGSAESPKDDCQGPCPVECWIAIKGDPSISLGTFFQRLMILTLKNILPVLRWNFMWFNLCPLPFALTVGTTEKSLSPSSSFPPMICVLWWEVDEMSPCSDT